MKKLLSISIAIFTTVILMSACGENGTGNATENATENVVVDSTQNATDVVKDTLVKK